jgi:hypothetical protein
MALFKKKKAGAGASSKGPKKGKKAGGYNNSGYGQEMMQGPYDNLMTPR